MADAVDAQQLYRQLLAEGKTPKDAAKEAQARTGYSLVSNKPIKPKGLKFSDQGVTYGQNQQLKSKPGKQRIPRQF
jgi:hypothetical protein